jgi:hypothetical protein
MQSFSQSGSDYSFSNALQHTPNGPDNIFNASLQDLNPQLQREKQQVETDLAHVDQSLNQLTSLK